MNPLSSLFTAGFALTGEDAFRFGDGLDGGGYYRIGDF